MYIIGIGSTSGPSDNRTFLLTPSNEIVTEMDTAAFVCIPANVLVAPSWSTIPNSSFPTIIGASNFFLTITNAAENVTVSCIGNGNTVSASLVVQGMVMF